jgi:hypothetical protein
LFKISTLFFVIDAHSLLFGAFIGGRKCCFFGESAPKLDVKCGMHQLGALS